MTQEALKLALNALEYHASQTRPIYQTDEAITAIKEALAQEKNFCSRCGKRLGGVDDIHTCTPPQRTEQEPVAWIHNFIDGGISIGKRPADLNRHPDRWTALYKDPKPCPTCEALARTVMLDQTSHDATPPQRTWVGLTIEEIAACCMESTTTQLSFYNAIEAKLKEKNS